MSLSREVVTLQLGHYANFVGTHWWNLQDASLNYDPGSAPSDPGSAPSDLLSGVLFREGQTLGGHVTYTPRLIAMDLKGSLVTLRQEGSLYDTQAEAAASTWQGEVVMHRETPPSSNPFLQDLDRLDKGELLAEEGCDSTPQASGSVVMETVNQQLERRHGYRLEDSVRVWSDFLRIHLHPRSVAVIHQYNHQGEAHRLQAFGQGVSLLQGPLLDDLEDRLHFYTEECDYLQGFQVLCDVADGFSGLGAMVTELLHDSYGGRGILTWGTSPVTHPDSTQATEVYHLLNSALATVALANHSSLFCPLTLRGGPGRRPHAPPTFPHLTYDPSLWYHSSAVLALSLDALSASYRLGQNPAPLWQLADSLTPRGRKVVAAYGAVPFPIMHGASLADALSDCADRLPWRPLSGCPEAGDGRCFDQSVTLKGLGDASLARPRPPRAQPRSPLHSLSCPEDILASYISTHYPGSPLAVHLVSSPSRLTPPFPQMFSQSLGPQGFLHSQAPPPGSAPPVSSLPLLSSLQSSPAVGAWLSALHAAARRIDPRRAAAWLACTEQDDLAGAMETLRCLATCYHDDRWASDDSDD